MEYLRECNLDVNIKNIKTGLQETTTVKMKRKFCRNGVHF